MRTLNVLLLLLQFLLSTGAPPSCPAPTLLPYDWRGNERALPKEKWPFRTDSPLTQRLVDKGLYLGRQSSLYAHVLSKLRVCTGSKEEVSMVVLGGSFSRGNGCGSGADRCAWHYRFAAWLRHSYPNATVNHINRAEGSTTSAFANHVIHNTLYPSPDVAFIDYSNNDVVWFADGFERGRSLLRAVTERNIVDMKKLHPKTALIYLSVYLGEHSGEIDNIYRQVCEEHGVAHLSYRRSVIENVTAAYNATLREMSPQQHAATYYLNNSEYPIFWGPAPLHYVHPNWIVHQLVCDLVASFFSRMSKILQLLSTTVIGTPRQDSSSAKPPPSDPFIHDLICQPVVMEKTSLPNNSTTNATTFPFEPSYRGLPLQCKGWELRSDQLGKPPGWIAETTSASNSADKEVVFTVVLVSGFVSISYLHTYRNAGKFSVFVAPTQEHWLTGHLLSDVHHPRSRKNVTDEEANYTLRCCDASSLGKGTASKQFHEHPTKPFTIDTFAASKFSNIRTTTLRVHGTGIFLIHFKHVPLGDDERKARGGDKVKILSLRSC
jgi:hypothetical protein